MAKKKEKIKTIMFFNNGNTAVFGENRQQISDFQKSWLLMFIEFLQSKGVKVEKIDEIVLPDFRRIKYLKKYHNWEIT